MREQLLHFKHLNSALGFALPHRNTIIVILLLTVLMAAANAAEPLVLKYIFDDLANQAAWKIVAEGLVLLSALAVLREVARGFSHWLTWRTRIGLQYALLEATVGKLHNMPLRMQRSVRC